MHWVELNEENWGKGIQEILRVIQPPRHLRSKPMDLSEEAVSEMIREQDFFDNYQNWDGHGLLHHYEGMVRQGQKLVTDLTTGLTWQRLGSDDEMVFEKAEKYIQSLNDQNFGGYNDWRLPTLEEAMSLLEPKKNNDGLYIDPVFDEIQSWLLTTDKRDASSAWVVDFLTGYCNHGDVTNDYYVRGVR